jgi:hypothetical protein
MKIALKRPLTAMKTLPWRSIRKTERSGAKQISKVVALGVLLLIQAGAEARGDARAAAADHASFQWFPRFLDPIVGVWNVSVDITNCATGATIASGEAMALFAADGTRHETNATNPALRSPAFGTWRRLGKKNNKYQFAFRFFRFDTAGVNLGSQVIRHDLVLSADGTSYFSEGTAEIFDPFGNLIVIGCSTATATRFE